jgi:arylformamidase
MNVHPGATARPKGPLVFLDMDQQSLDDAYDQEIWAPNRALIVERRKAASERARAVLGMPKRVAYGPGEHEGLDIFDCGIKGAPINVFFTAAPGGGTSRRITPCKPSRSFAPAPIA